MQGLIGKYLQPAADIIAWFAPVSAYALLPMLVPAAVVGVGAVFVGWNAPPHTLAEIAWRIFRALLLFGVLFLAILCLFTILLGLAPAAGIFTPAFSAFIVLPVVACWVFGLVWRLGHDLGLLSAHVRAARWQAGNRQRRNR